MIEHFDNRGQKETFAGRYYCYQLIYFERHTVITIAIEREKEIKDLSRELKLQLIKSVNPKMNFLKISEDWQILLLSLDQLSLVPLTSRLRIDKVPTE